MCTCNMTWTEMIGIILQNMWHIYLGIISPNPLGRPEGFQGMGLDQEDMRVRRRKRNISFFLLHSLQIEVTNSPVALFCTENTVSVQQLKIFTYTQITPNPPFIGLRWTQLNRIISPPYPGVTLDYHRPELQTVNYLTQYTEQNISNQILPHKKGLDCKNSNTIEKLKITTGKTSQAITPFHFFDYYNFSLFYHLKTFITISCITWYPLSLHKVYHKILKSWRKNLTKIWK